MIILSFKGDRSSPGALPEIFEQWNGRRRDHVLGARFHFRDGQLAGGDPQRGAAVVESVNAFDDRRLAVRHGDVGRAERDGVVGEQDARRFEFRRFLVRGFHGSIFERKLSLQTAAEFE